MTHKSEEYWKKHIENWKASELSMTGYSKKNGLVPSTFKRQILKQDKTRIVPMKVNFPEARSQTQMIIVEGSGIRVQLSENIEPSLLIATIREMKKCS